MEAQVDGIGVSKWNGVVLMEVEAIGSFSLLFWRRYEILIGPCQKETGQDESISR